MRKGSSAEVLCRPGQLVKRGAKEEKPVDEEEDKEEDKDDNTEEKVGMQEAKGGARMRT